MPDPYGALAGLVLNALYPSQSKQPEFTGGGYQPATSGYDPATASRIDPGVGIVPPQPASMTPYAANPARRSFNNVMGINADDQAAMLNQAYGLQQTGAQNNAMLGAGGMPGDLQSYQRLLPQMLQSALAQQQQKTSRAQLGTGIAQGALPLANLAGQSSSLAGILASIAGGLGSQNQATSELAQAPGMARQGLAQQSANTTGNENISTANKAVADLVGPNAFANMSANTGGANMQQADFKNRLAQIVAANPYQSQIGRNTAANQATQTGLEGTALKDLGLNLGQGANLYMGPNGNLVGTPYGGINPQAAFSQNLLRGAMPNLPPLNVAPGYQAPARVIPANALDQLRRTPGTKEGGNDISTPITPGGATNGAPAIAPQTNNIQSLLNSPQVIQMIQQAIQKQTGGGMTPANIAAFEKSTSPSLPSWISGPTSKQLDIQMSAYDKAHPRMKD
jgi:hypothetical protein